MRKLKKELIDEILQVENLLLLANRPVVARANMIKLPELPPGAH